jgi:salicylate hydroxylase
MNAIRAASSVSATIPFLHYQTGAKLAGEYDRSDGTKDVPELVGRQIHRADLHRILADKVQATASDGLYLDHKLVGIDQVNGTLSVRFGNGASYEADLVIGADGLKSATRQILFGADAPQFTGQVAYRFLVPIEIAGQFMGAGRAAVYFGPRRVLNRYTLRSGTIVNCVAIAQSDIWGDDGWSIPGNRDELLAEFSGWHQDVTGLIALAPPDRLIKWGLFEREPLPTWRSGHITLLGDAAHPMLPFMGLGAAMAIEDAMILARALERSTDLATGLADYEANRIPRTAEVLRQSRLQGKLLQSRDPNSYSAAQSPTSDSKFFEYDPVTAPLIAPARPEPAPAVL